MKNRVDNLKIRVVSLMGKLCGGQEGYLLYLRAGVHKESFEDLVEQ